MSGKPLLVLVIASAALGAFIGASEFSKETGYAIGFAGLLLIMIGLAVYERVSGVPIGRRSPR